jgi:hypothetical protein
MSCIVKAIANETAIGGVTTLEDETWVDKVISIYQELKKAKEMEG